MGKLGAVSPWAVTAVTPTMRMRIGTSTKPDDPAGLAGCNFIIGMPLGDDDIMLNYQTTAFHDIATIRPVTRPAPCAEIPEARWKKMGLMENGRLTNRAGDPFDCSSDFRGKSPWIKTN